MRRTHGAAAVVVATTALFAIACSSGPTRAGISSPPAPAMTGTLVGSGSTFQAAFQRSAISAFKSAQPGIKVDYDGGGSGKGRADLAAGLVNYAGSDTAPVPASELPRFSGRSVLYFPVVIGPIAIAFNLPGISTLRLSGPLIADIFQGTITTWSDPAIAAENPGVKLPSMPIIVARRSDSSGTTQNFSQFLVDSAPQVWRLGSGSIINWPANTQPGAGNEGVAEIIRRAPGAIGYVDFADAKADGLTYASIKNETGRYVVPSPTSAAAAASQVSVRPDLTFSAIWAPGVGSYPITYQSWVLVYAQQPNANDAKLLLAWLGYLLGDGQTLLIGLNYSPLPSIIDQLAVHQLSKIAP